MGSGKGGDAGHYQIAIRRFSLKQLSCGLYG
jgi:hypothetical protein